jgi:hypothetical protein
MAQKLTTNLKWKHFAKITGSTGFPIDMLRYDNCIPASEEDARIIERANDVYVAPGETWTVQVKKFSELKTHAYWTPQRWRSFGCALEETEGYEYA